MALKSHSEMHEEIISKFNELLSEVKELRGLKSKQMDIEHPIEKVKKIAKSRV